MTQTEPQVYVNGVAVGSVEDFNMFAKGVNEMTEEIAKTKPSQKEYFEKFKNVYNELYLLNQDLKQLSEDFKEDHPDADLSNLKAVAKLVSDNTLGDKVNKVDKFKDAVELFVG